MVEGVSVSMVGSSNFTSVWLLDQQVEGLIMLAILNEGECYIVL